MRLFLWFSNTVRATFIFWVTFVCNRSSIHWESRNLSLAPFSNWRHRSGFRNLIHPQRLSAKEFGIDIATKSPRPFFNSVFDFIHLQELMSPLHALGFVDFFAAAVSTYSVKSLLIWRWNHLKSIFGNRQVKVLFWNVLIYYQEYKQWREITWHFYLFANLVQYCFYPGLQ